MKETVYLETSVVSYLASPASRDVVVAAHLRITKEWWQHQKEFFDIYVSEIVRQEISAGDPRLAGKRLSLIAPLKSLIVTKEALLLAETLVSSGVVPAKAAMDALHISVATVNGISYLLTWNCRHIANAAIRCRIEATCKSANYVPPVLCTPEELFGGTQ